MTPHFAIAFDPKAVHPSCRFMNARSKVLPRNLPAITAWIGGTVMRALVAYRIPRPASTASNLA